MDLNYDFFDGKEDLTDDDIEDFEAHADMMLEINLARMDKKIEQEIAKEKDAKNDKLIITEETEKL